MVRPNRIVLAGWLVASAHCFALPYAGKRSASLSRSRFYAGVEERSAPLSSDTPLNPPVDDVPPPILVQQETRSRIVTLLEDSYAAPRWVLAGSACIYGTNFALGAFMNEAVPCAAVTATRMTLAAAALSPWLLKLKPEFVQRAIGCGCATALGYVTQSLALAETDPAKVSFLGSVTVLWLPVLEFLVDKKDMSISAAPQTWLAALLCLVGVGVLEGVDLSSLHNGDALALVQAVGFGTGVFLSAKLVREEPTQVLPVTSALIATSAVIGWIWCALDPNVTVDTANTIFSSPQIMAALVWTGIVSTSFNFVAEVAALGHVPSSEASVLLASEPVWAAAFAAALLGQPLGMTDLTGGALILAACLVNAVLTPQHFQKVLKKEQ